MKSTGNFLEQIMQARRAQVARRAAAVSPNALRDEARRARARARPQALRAAIKDRARINVIAEIKRASPSQGTIRSTAVPAEIALSYSAGGAAAISVLTEEDYFRGSLDDLRAVRAAVDLPVLRKDFIFDEFQIYEAAAAGADALLLIAAALDDEQLARLRRITEEELMMDALVEVHTNDELRRALGCGAALIGVNNRNLQTFEVSLDTSIKLIQEAPPGAIFIAESGLSTGEHLRRLSALGYRGFLIGETLMRAADPGAALRALLDEADSGAETGTG
jgi:indole-3-glycerol phosphate synthase